MNAERPAHVHGCMLTVLYTDGCPACDLARQEAADPWAPLFAEVRAEIGAGGLGYCATDLLIMAGEAAEAMTLTDDGSAEERAATLRMVVCGIRALAAIDREAGK